MDSAAGMAASNESVEETANNEEFPEVNLFENDQT